VQVIALRGCHEHDELYVDVVNGVRAMSFETMRPANWSLQAMQALLLLCHWPLPYEKHDDPSLSLIAIATQMGFRMGLHRPDHTFEFMVDSHSHMELDIFRRRTWVACFVMNVG